MIGTSSWKAFTELAHPARTGRPALGWQAMMEHFAEHPDEAALFNAAMVDKAAGVVPAVVQAYDFSPFATIVDVGGGRGHLLSAILEGVPQAAGVLFETLAEQLPRILEPRPQSCTPETPRWWMLQRLLQESPSGRRR